MAKKKIKAICFSKNILVYIFRHGVFFIVSCFALAKGGVETRGVGHAVYGFAGPPVPTCPCPCRAKSCPSPPIPRAPCPLPAPRRAPVPDPCPPLASPLSPCPRHDHVIYESQLIRPSVPLSRFLAYAMCLALGAERSLERGRMHSLTDITHHHIMICLYVAFPRFPPHA